MVKYAVFLANYCLHTYNSTVKGSDEDSSYILFGVSEFKCLYILMEDR